MNENHQLSNEVMNQRVKQQTIIQFINESIQHKWVNQAIKQHLADH